MGMTIAVVNQKGGVGKTTTVLNLGAALAEMGKRILLVDFDPQSSLSADCLGIRTPEHTIHEALFTDDGDRDRFLTKTGVENLWLVPATIDLSSAEHALVGEMNRERFLDRVLRPWRERFDYILIDNSPSLGLLTINTMAAADGVLVPVQCQWLALKALPKLLETLDKVKSREIKADLEIIGILPTMYNPTIKQSQEVVDVLRNKFGPLVYKTVIRNRAAFSYAPVASKPITVQYPSSDEAEMYRAVAREILGEAVPMEEAAPTTADV